MGFKNLKLGNRITALAALGAVGLTITGCCQMQIVDNDDYDNQYDEQEVNGDNELNIEENNVEKNIESETDPHIVLDRYNLSDINVKISNAFNNKIQNYIDGVDVTYKYSEYFNTKEALNAYNNMKLNKVSNSANIINNGKVDKNQLSNCIKQNTEKFFNTYKGNNYKKISSGKMETIIDVLSKQIGNIIQNNNDIDISILNNTLSRLEVMEYKSFGNAFVSVEEPRLCFNFTAIDAQQKNNPKVNMLERVIEHEAGHIVQASYPQENEFEHNMGISYSYSNLKVNTLYWDWFIEGSAEKLTLVGIEDQPYNYSAHVGAIKTLAITNILNSNGVKDIENLSLQKDLNSLFEMFGANTEKEQEEIINMMFAYDIILSENSDFKEHIRETKEFSLTDLYEYKDELKPSIGITLTKNFYSNLSNKLTNDDASLEDVFMLMRIFETEMCYLTEYDLEKNEQLTKEFVSTYSNIQNQFFEGVSASVNINSQELKQMYCAYSDIYFTSAKDKVDAGQMLNTNLEWLNKEQKEFLEFESKEKVLYISRNINK